MAPGGLLEQQALSVVNGSEKASARTGLPLPDLWLAMQQTVSRVTGRDISIFMATVQVYFRYKFWKISNKKSKWIYDTGDVVCELPGGNCVLIPYGHGWTYSPLLSQIFVQHSVRINNPSLRYHKKQNIFVLKQWRCSDTFFYSFLTLVFQSCVNMII